MRLYFLILWVGFYLVLSHTAVLQAQHVPSNEIEIIVEGKRYKSVLAYKREQIKRALIQSLAPVNLHNFTEEELYDIIKEVRELQTVDAGTNKAIEPKKQQSGKSEENLKKIEESPEDLSTFQMKEMLNDYFKEHKDASPLSFDPAKVKNILIEPSKSQTGIPGN